MYTRTISRPLMALLLATATLVALAQNTLVDPPNTVDGLIILEGQKLIDNANGVNVRPAKDGRSIELKDGAVTGTIHLQPVIAEFPFNEALPSWNGSASGNSGFQVFMAPVFTNAGAQPYWFPAGYWGNISVFPDRKLTLPFGLYDIDMLLLNQPARGMQFKIDLVRDTPKSPSPSIRLIALSYTNSTGDRALYQKFGKPRNAPATDSAQVNVPFFSQVVKDEKIIGRICAPCSVNSALGAFEIKKDTEQLARQQFDAAANAFGVWNRSVQGGAQHGLRGYLTRFRNWQDVQKALQQGHVIAASIRFEPGEVEDPLRSAGKREKGTKGHLVIIKGVTANGQVIVHDTASKDVGPDSRWKQEELAKAWFAKGGVAYVFTGKAGGSSRKR